MELKTFILACLVSVCVCSFNSMTKYDKFELPSDAWATRVIKSISDQTRIACGAHCKTLRQCGGFHWETQECSLLKKFNPYDLDGTENGDAVYIDLKG
jgi:hypothetical protein